MIKPQWNQWGAPYSIFINLWFVFHDELVSEKKPGAQFICSALGFLPMVALLPCWLLRMSWSGTSHDLLTESQLQLHGYGASFTNATGTLVIKAKLMTKNLLSNTIVLSYASCKIDRKVHTCVATQSGEVSASVTSNSIIKSTITFHAIFTTEKIFLLMKW